MKIESSLRVPAGVCKVGTLIIVVAHYIMNYLRGDRRD